MIRETGERIGERIANATLNAIGRTTGRKQERRPLPVDVLESDEAYLAVFDAPGADRDDVQVQYEQRTVTVRIDRGREMGDAYEMRFPGRGDSLSGRVQLPDDARVNAEAATATLLPNGTLRIRLPKAAEAKD